MFLVIFVLFLLYICTRIFLRIYTRVYTSAYKSAAKLQKKIDIHKSVCHFLQKNAIFVSENLDICEKSSIFAENLRRN